MKINDDLRKDPMIDVILMKVEDNKNKAEKIKQKLQTLDIDSDLEEIAILAEDLNFLEGKYLRLRKQLVYAILEYAIDNKLFSEYIWNVEGLEDGSLIVRSNNVDEEDDLRCNLKITGVFPYEELTVSDAIILKTPRYSTEYFEFHFDNITEFQRFVKYGDFKITFSLEKIDTEIVMTTNFEKRDHLLLQKAIILGFLDGITLYQFTFDDE